MGKRVAMTHRERRIIAAAIGYVNEYSRKGRYDRCRKPLDRLRQIVWQYQGNRGEPV